MTIWPGKGATRKFIVKLKVVKLEGFVIKDETSAKMAVKVDWNGSTKSSISSLYKKSQHDLTKEVDVVKMGEPTEWNEEFDHICTFNIMNSKNKNLFASWMVNFTQLYGTNEEPSSSSSRAKMQVIGKGGLNLGELASKMEDQSVQNVPISLEMDGVVMDANLLVLVSFNEMNNRRGHSRTLSSDSFRNVENSRDLTNSLRRAKSQGPNSTLGHEKVKKNKIVSLFGRQLSWKSKGNESEYVVVASSTGRGEANTVTELGMTASYEAQLDMAKKGGFWKWKRRKSMKKGVTPEITELEAENCNPEIWQMKETVSRDGKTKLIAELFFASYDQRSEKASGESACAAIVAVIAHWLQQNPYLMPARQEFDHLITEGSTEWRRLCNDETNKDFFPDRHFDFETILRAELRPIIVLPNESHFGFFHPEEFEHLKGAKSFDEIWDEINENVSDFESRVYIVRWNDHFFIIKIEGKACYIIDSLGERLYEGCQKAYILKFDESSIMYAKKEEGKDEEDVAICQGKECCREYMKRFLAAIPVRELKEQEAKGKMVDMVVLHQRLLIDFHLSTPSSTVSTVNTSNNASPSTSPFLLGHEDLEI